MRQAVPSISRKQFYLCGVISQSGKIDKQAEILSAALKLFVEFGFHGTPTSRIAGEAGVANGTLFHYYKTKDELVVALYIDIKKRMACAVNDSIEKAANLENTLKSMFVASLEWGLQNRMEFSFMQQFHSSPFISHIPAEELARQTKPHLRLLEEGIKTGLIKPLPVDFLHILISSHLFGIHQYLISSNFDDQDRVKVIDESFEMIWDMIT